MSIVKGIKVLIGLLFIVSAVLWYFSGLPFVGWVAVFLLIWAHNCEFHWGER